MLKSRAPAVPGSGVSPSATVMASLRFNPAEEQGRGLGDGAGRRIGPGIEATGTGGRGGTACRSAFRARRQTRGPDRPDPDCRGGPLWPPIRSATEGNRFSRPAPGTPLGPPQKRPSESSGPCLVPARPV